VTGRGYTLRALGSLWVVFEAFCRRPVEWKPLLLESGTVACGIVLPFVAILVLTARQGVFDRFRFWTADHARDDASEVDLITGFLLNRFRIKPVVQSNPLIW